MFMIREVMQCKPGKVKEMAKRFKAMSDVMKGMGLPQFRVFTDLSGEPFWTMVAQIEVESLNAFLEMESQVMGNEEAGRIMAGYHELLTSGRREIYRVES
jgi:hypothetical protein